MKNTPQLEQDLGRLRKIFAEEGILSVADERCRGFSRYCLKKLLEEGFLTRVSRGVYSHAGRNASETMNYEEIAKVREKIAEYQDKLKTLEAQKTEAENLEIVQMVRALRLTPEQLNAMLSGGTVPGMVAASADYDEQEDTDHEE